MAPADAIARDGTGRSRPGLVAIVGVATAATFAADVQLTLGASAAPLYEVAVLLALWSPARHFAAGTAGVVTVLLFAEAAVLREDPWQGMSGFNRAMTLLAVWSTALLVVLYKRAEDALDEKRREARSYIAAAAVAFVILDRAGRVVLVNRKTSELLGAPADAVVGRPWLDAFVPPEQREEARSIHERLLAGELPSGHDHESAILTASGERRSVAWRGGVLTDSSGRPRGLVISGEDVTEKRRAEDAARAQQALARVGQMAAVVAHEVRNPLAGIKAAVQVLGRRVPDGTQERHALRAVLDRIDALTDMTDDLLVFARPPAQRRAVVSIRAVLRDAAQLLAASPEHAAVCVELRGEDAEMLGDARRLKNAFFNVLLNGAQAMGARGTIRVSLERVGAYSRVTVADEGPGIPPEWRERIFEPFFTTRHRGTGLGLAIVKRDVEAHGGQVAVVCPPTGGTVVAVSLPVARS